MNAVKHDKTLVDWFVTLGSRVIYYCLILIAVCKIHSIPLPKYQKNFASPLYAIVKFKIKIKNLKTPVGLSDGEALISGEESHNKSVTHSACVSHK